MKRNLAFEARGKAYWRSLEQLAQTTKFKEQLQREFPEGASELESNNWSRRSFLTLMGASIALAGLSGCRRPVEKIVPYVTRPEEITPGNPLTYATNMPLGLQAYGLLATSHEGRPTKLDGNPMHPSTRGASNTLLQAALLGLYDPDRSQRPLHQGAEKDWEAFVSAWRELQLQYVQNGGAGLAVLSEAFASPTLAALKAEFQKTYPNATWVSYEPVSDENMFAGLELATGRLLQPVYDFTKADVVVSFDSDFLQQDGNPVTNSLDFSARRRVLSQKDSMNRLYVVENCFTITGGMADHRMRVARSRVGQAALALAKELMVQGVKIDGVDAGTTVRGSFDAKWLRVAASDLRAAEGRSLVLAGYGQPAWVHALVFAINAALKANGSTVSYREPKYLSLPSRDGLKQLTGKMASGGVETLIVLGGNPVYTAPVELNFAGALRKVKTKISFSYYNDQTARRCDWHLPRTHFLESWGDTISSDGTLGVTQPLIEPLFQSRSDIEFVSLVTSGTDARGYDRVRQTWQPLLKSDFEKKWRVVLHDGVWSDQKAEFVSVTPNGREIASAVAAAPAPAAQSENTFELDFRPSNVYDGRFANNGWLQELPNIISKLSWDNAALICPSTAKRLGIANEDVIRIDHDGRSLDIVAWITPGQAEDSITLQLGYGQEELGRVAAGAGFNSYLLRTMQADFVHGATVNRTGRTYELANTQDHGSMEGRPIVREATLAAYLAADAADEEVMQYELLKPTQPHHPPLAPLWDAHTYDTGYQWGMTIDLNACTGCNACTIACQSENNIAIVGKEQVRNGREMHWIRLDRYFAGDNLDEPQLAVQPVACQHCEYAPCESVCPVAATVHSDDGLNVMVYNRCIGTRYCSNNCPYKVRRFNFFNYTNQFPEIHKMSQNPEVTVRSRGVMEKCTYCLQRIANAKIVSKREGRKIVDDDVKTACQVACPTQAIVFGDINDPNSQVSAMKKVDRQYRLLEELMTKPRTSFLAKLRNPHPELAAAEPTADAAGHH